MNNEDKYAELRGAIRTKFKTQQAFADALQMNPSTLSAKLTGRSEWAFNEVVTACRVLGITLADAPSYFFS